MKPSVVITVAVCLLLLVGAWATSHALLNEDSIKPPPSSFPEFRAQPQPPPPIAQPVVVRTPPPPPVDTRPVVPTITEVREPVQPAIAVAPPPEPEPVPPPPPEEKKDPPADEAESAFLGDSRELSYAESLLQQGNPREKLLSARDTFTRCLELHPDHSRCIEGLERANTMLRPTKANRAMKPFMPLQMDKIHP